MSVQGGRIAIVSVAGVVWTLITLLGALVGAPPEQPLADLVAEGIAWQFVAACLFLLALLAWFRWDDLGLVGPRPVRSLLILWFPGLYLILFLALTALLGFPPASAVAFIFVNAALVGVSEELMFRGVLFSGLRSRLSMWPALLWTSLLFGLVHVLNVLVTGDLPIAMVQAIAAFMSGVLYIAVRIRTGSLYPGIVLHALWDFGALVLIRSSLPLGSSPGEPGVLNQFLPAAIVLPLFLYALFLLRGVGAPPLAEPSASH